MQDVLFYKDNLRLDQLYLEMIILNTGIQSRQFQLRVFFFGIIHIRLQ